MNFLKERKLVLNEEEVTVFSGIPQGNELSPIFFNLYSAELHEIEEEGVYIVEYDADDFIIIVVVRNLNEAKKDSSLLKRKASSDSQQYRT